MMDSAIDVGRIVVIGVGVFAVAGAAARVAPELRVWIGGALAVFVLAIVILLSDV